MMRWIGRECPAVIVFMGMACAILICENEVSALVFCLSMMSLVVSSRRNLAHAVLGAALGVSAYGLQPGWALVPEGAHGIAGVVEEKVYDHGRCMLTLTDVRVDGHPFRGRALVALKEDMQGIGKGVRISARMIVNEPRGRGNGGEFDYRRYLLTRGIVVTGSVPKDSLIRLHGHIRPGGLRPRLIERLNLRARPECEIIKAMVLGDRSGIARDIQDRLNSIGVAHLIAISGLHIGIVMVCATSLAFGVLRFAAIFVPVIDTPLVARVLGMAAAVGYTWFVGAGVTVVRACIMAVSIFFSLFYLKRKAELLEGLAVSGIVILAAWPLALFSASFLLSFCAVLGIAAVMKKTEGAPLWVTSLLVTPAAGIFTLPVMVYLFGFVSATGVPANLVLVPVVSVFVMPLAMAGIVMDLLGAGSASPWSFPLDIAMDAVGLMLRLADGLGSLHPVSRPCPEWVYACIAGLSIAFFSQKCMVRTVTLVILGASVVVTPLARQALINTEPMCFDFISVGDGDCTLLTSEGRAVLVDAGPARGDFDAGRTIVAPHLLWRGVSRLDLFVITHMHPDHAGGASFILERFPVSEVWINARADGNPYYEEVTRITRRKSIPIRCVHRGRTFRFGGAWLEVLSPLVDFSQPSKKVDQNMQSIVIMVQDGKTRGLLMADAHFQGELILVHLNEDIHAQVLKASHHGSKMSCLDVFLDAVRPTIAVISVGEKGPSCEALERLGRSNVQVFRTDLHGGVTMVSGRGGIQVKSAWNPADTHLRCHTCQNCTHGGKQGARRPAKRG